MVATGGAFSRFRQGREGAADGRRCCMIMYILPSDVINGHNNIIQCLGGSRLPHTLRTRREWNENEIYLNHSRNTVSPDVHTTVRPRMPIYVYRYTVSHTNRMQILTTDTGLLTSNDERLYFL